MNRTSEQSEQVRNLNKWAIGTSEQSEQLSKWAIWVSWLSSKKRTSEHVHLNEPCLPNTNSLNLLVQLLGWHLAMNSWTELKRFDQRFLVNFSKLWINYQIFENRLNDHFNECLTFATPRIRKLHIEINKKSIAP